MDVQPRKLWVTRLKESTSVDLIRDTFSTNASKVLKVTLISGGSACLVFATESAAKAAQQDVKKVDGRQVAIQVYRESLFAAALPNEAAKIKVPRIEANVLLDQGKKSLLSVSRKHGVFWTEDSVEGLHLYCSPAKANMVLGEINNIKRLASKVVKDKPNIKPTVPDDTSSTTFGMGLAQTAMPTAADMTLVEQTVGMTSQQGDQQEEGYVITSPGGTASALPPPAPPTDDMQNLTQCMITRLRTADSDAVNKFVDERPHQKIGNMEIKINDELLQYLIKYKANELKNIEDKSDVNIAKHPGKIIISMKPECTGSKNAGIALAYSDFLQIYNETQEGVKFVNLDLRPLNMTEASVNQALKKIETACPNVMIFNKFKDQGVITLVGPEEDVKKGFLHLPSKGRADLSESITKQEELPFDFKKDIKGKDGYSYFGDLAKMNAQKIYTYRDTGSGIMLIVKKSVIGEEEVGGVIQYCDTKGKVLSLAAGSGRAQIGQQSLGATAVNTTNQTVKNAQVLHACVSDGAISKSNIETGLKNALISCSQMKLKSVALPPLATGKAMSDLGSFMDAFVSAFRHFASTEGANSSIKDIRLISKDPLAIEILSDRFDKEYSRISGPLSRGASPATGKGKPSWSSKLKQLASPENK